MPIYDYRCHVCGQRFSAFSRTMSSSADAKPVTCPNCGSKDTERVMSPFAVHGPAGVDAQEVAAERSQAERTSSITPKKQIDQWRSASKGSASSSSTNKH